MTSQAAIIALVELALMLAVVAAYVVSARRFRVLWHPLSIAAAVFTVSVIVAVLGELIGAVTHVTDDGQLHDRAVPDLRHPLRRVRVDGERDRSHGLATAPPLRRTA